MFDAAFRKAPFMRVLLPLTGGIMLARQICLPAITAWITAGMLMLVILLTTVMADRPCRPAGFLSGRHHTWLACLFQGLFVCVGLFLGREKEPGPVPETLLQARVCDEVLAGERSCRTMLDRVIYHTGRGWARLEGGVQVFLGPEKRCRDLKPGDCIWARGKLQRYGAPANPFGFNYGAYQRGRGVYYHLYLDSLSWMPATACAGQGWKIRARLLRRNLIRRMEEQIDGADERAILYALLLGYRAALGEDVKRHFVRSGSMHILAVSGLHVGILYMFPAFLIGRIRRRVAGRLIANFFLLTLLWSYAGLTGLSPSVVRAVTMCSIHRAAVLTGRRTGIFHVLSLTAYIMVLARPDIIFEAGFQLSFAAVAGIAGLQKPISRLWAVKGWLARWIWQLLTVSLAAQLATAPLSIYHFHQVSPVSVPTSLAVIPLATLILYVGLAFMLLSAMGFYPLSGVLEWLASLLGGITRLAGRIAGDFGEDIGLLPVQVILLYLALALACLFLHSRRVYLIQGMMVTAALWVLVSGIREYRARIQEGFYVFSLPRETAISFVMGKEHVMYRAGKMRGDTLQVPPDLRNFCARRKLSPPAFLSCPGLTERSLIRHHCLDAGGVRGVLVRFRESRILILRRWPASSPGPSRACQTDILVLTEHESCNPDGLFNVFKPGQVIVDGSSHARVHEAMAAACRQHGIPFHSTEKHGFYVH